MKRVVSEQRITAPSKMFHAEPVPVAHSFKLSPHTRRPLGGRSKSQIKNGLTNEYEW
jgi:hypothetical protein